MQVLSNITRDDSDCTMTMGIMGVDGVLRGALADVDLFAAFSLALSQEYRKCEDGSCALVPLNDFDLWEVKDKRDRTVINRKAKKRLNDVRPSRYDDNGFIPSARVEYLRVQYEAAEQLRAEFEMDELDGISPFEDD